MAHTARSSRAMMLFLLLLCFPCWFSCFSAHVNNIYSCQTFLDIGFTMQSTVTNEFHHAYGIPMEIARPEGAHWTVIGTGKRQRQRRDRKQKRGCHSGLWARLRKDPHRPTLLSMFLTNTQSLNKKMDELKLRMDANRYIPDCCVLAISKFILFYSISTIYILYIY